MDILQEIINMDKEAAQRCEAAQKELLEKLNEKSEKAARRRDSHIEKERTRMEEFRQEQQEALEKKRHAAHQHCESEKARLDDIFANNRKSWKAEIMNKVTGA